jgi:hypothetical protein
MPDDAGVYTLISPPEAQDPQWRCIATPVTHHMTIAPDLA